nr:hypothetical protein [Actinomycetota bacterium]
MSPRLFALDQGFPQPIVQSLSEYLEDEVALRPIAAIDPRLTENMDDWQILLALHHHAEPWDGLITTDSGMLALPRELAVVLQTKLSLVVVLESGHDPVKATGILLAQISGICKRNVPNRGQIWALRTVEKRPEDPWDQLHALAERRGVERAELWEDARLSAEQLAHDPLA